MGSGTSPLSPCPPHPRETSSFVFGSPDPALDPGMGKLKAPIPALGRNPVRLLPSAWRGCLCWGGAEREQAVKRKTGLVGFIPNLFLKGKLIFLN